VQYIHNCHTCLVVYCLCQAECYWIWHILNYYQLSLSYKILENNLFFILCQHHHIQEESDVTLIHGKVAGFQMVIEWWQLIVRKESHSIIIIIMYITWQMYPCFKIYFAHLPHASCKLIYCKQSLRIWAQVHS
jgi:hypothetical protein